MASAEARQDECLAWAAAFELAFVLGEGHVHHELALGRMTGNIPSHRHASEERMRSEMGPGREQLILSI